MAALDSDVEALSSQVNEAVRAGSVDAGSGKPTLSRPPSRQEAGPLRTGDADELVRLAEPFRTVVVEGLPLR